MINNRQQQQAGRRRGRGGNGSGNGNTGGSAPRQGGQGRPDNGNRIDNRARGNANQLYEKYKNLAADSQRQGDRVNTEYYLQFADHYFRVLSDQRGRFDDQPQPRRSSQDFDGDDDYGDEGEPIRAGEQGETQRQDRSDRQDRLERQDRSERPERQAERPDRPREGRRTEGRTEAVRGEGGERPRRWENRDERGPRSPDRADADVERNDEPRAQYQPQAEFRPETEVAGQHRADPVVVGENLEQRAEAIIEADAPLAPRRRGRPRRDAVPVVEAVGESNGVDADRLPPSLGIVASDGPDGEEAPKPRRRRTRTAVAGDAPTS